MEMNKEKINNIKDDIVIDDNASINCDIKRIDKYFDLFDLACNLLYDKLGIKYLDAFLRIYQDISNAEIDSKGLDDKDIEKLSKIEDEIANFYALNEEIREALLLVLIRGFKHENMNLDSITPDFVCMIFAYLVKNAFFGKTKRVSILDCNLGSANLLNVIANNTNLDLDLIGIEIDPKMANIARAVSNLQGNDIRIYLNNCLDLDICADLVISDLESKEDDKFFQPYPIIINLVNSAKEKKMNNSLFLFLIDNDFFQRKGIEVFRKEFMGTMMGLLVLPDDILKDKNKGKSILVISPNKYKNYQTLAVNIPSVKEEKKLQDTLYSVGKWLKNIIDGGDK